MFDRFENGLLDMVQGRLVLIGKNVAEARDTEQLFVRVHGLSDAIAKEDESIARLEFHAGSHVIGSRDEAQRKRTLGEGLGNLAATKKEWRRMTGIDEFQTAVSIEDTKEHRGVSADLDAFAEKAIEVIEDTRGVGADAHARESALQHGGKERGAEAFPGDIRNEKGCAVITHREDVEVIAAHGQAGRIGAGDGKMRVIAKAARVKGPLDVASDAEFLLEALALALAFHEACVVQNARGFDAQGVEDLAIKFGKGSGPAGIQIDNSEKIPSLDLSGGFRAAGARHGIEGNGHDGPKTLRDDALRNL
jgi:hypothetical protein